MKQSYINKYRKQLAQTHLLNTDAVSAYTSGKGILTTIETIIICNTGAAAATFQICVDINGTTHDESTAIHWDQPIPAYTTVTLEKTIHMNQYITGQISLQASVTNALTFTISGEEYT